MDRKAVMIELKESYFRQLCKNLHRAETEEKKQGDLFAIEAPQLEEADDAD